jgi:hypothetical protein
MGFQGSKHEWQGAIYQQSLATSMQGWGTELFMSMAESAYRPRGGSGWAGRPEPYRKEECKEYFAPDLRRGADYPSRQMLAPVVGRFGLLLSTTDHSV